MLISVPTILDEIWTGGKWWGTVIVDRLNPDPPEWRGPQHSCCLAESIDQCSEIGPITKEI